MGIFGDFQPQENIQLNPPMMHFLREPSVLLHMSASGNLGAPKCHLAGCSQSLFSRSYGSVLPNSLTHTNQETRGCTPWGPDAVSGTVRSTTELPSHFPQGTKAGPRVPRASNPVRRSRDKPRSPRATHPKKAFQGPNLRLHTPHTRCDALPVRRTPAPQTESTEASGQWSVIEER